MQVTEITVHAGRTFSHPHESYSNLKPGVSLKAILAEGEDPIIATRDLQAKAEQLVEDHKRNLLGSIEQVYDMAMRDQEITKLESLIRTSQSRLESIRQNGKALPAQEEMPY